VAVRPLVTIPRDGHRVEKSHSRHRGGTGPGGMATCRKDTARSSRIRFPVSLWPRIDVQPARSVPVVDVRWSAARPSCRSTTAGNTVRRTVRLLSGRLRPVGTGGRWSCLRAQPRAATRAEPPTDRGLRGCRPPRGGRLEAEGDRTRRPRSRVQRPEEVTHLVDPVEDVVGGESQERGPSALGPLFHLVPGQRGGYRWTVDGPERVGRHCRLG